MASHWPKVRLHYNIKRMRNMKSQLWQVRIQKHVHNQPLTRQCRTWLKGGEVELGLPFCAMHTKRLLRISDWSFASQALQCNLQHSLPNSFNEFPRIPCTSQIRTQVVSIIVDTAIANRLSEIKPLFPGSLQDQLIALQEWHTPWQNAWCPLPRA